MKRAVQEAYGRPTQIFDTIRKSIDPGIERNNPDCISDILEWMVQQYREPILDYAEKKYLSEVIRPFREEVIAIEKLETYTGEEYILILFRDDGMHFPSFRKDTRYKGLKLEKRYTPEELGL